ncbi:MAG: FMN-binding negative transcriptional regulator [Neomegalonema sp.]|nr:FMN-binding negative transcriptional regulator [Neomegalonema sp.]
MHPNPAFRRASRADALILARTRGFGLLTINGADGPLAAHVPFVLNEAGDCAEFHLVRSNPIAVQMREGETSALIAVSGADAYISPDWYGLGPDQVPTWNYVAAHLRGTARLRPHDALRPHLARLSAHFEQRLAPKPPWTLDKMSEGAVEKMGRAIVPGELRIERMESTLKVGQNKPPQARLGAAEGVASAQVGSESAAAIAALMRRSLEDDADG